MWPLAGVWLSMLRCLVQRQGCLHHSTMAFMSGFTNEIAKAMGGEPVNNSRAMSPLSVARDMSPRHVDANIFSPLALRHLKSRL